MTIEAYVLQSELQRSQGFDEFMKSLPAGTLEWWEEVGLMSALL